MTVTRVPASNPEPEVPITDPRWLVSTQPDREPEPKPDIHWMVVTGPRVFNACGAPSGSRANSIAHQVTCPACLDTIVRTKCLAPDPDDVLGIGIVCKQKLDTDGTHEGLHDWEKPLTSALTNQERDLALAMDTPSGRLPVRTPGAALRDEEDSNGPGGPSEAARPGESILGRPVIERWPA